MALTVSHIPRDLSRLLPPWVSFRFRLLIDGEVTATKKWVAFYRGASQLNQVCLAVEALDGQFTRYERVLQQALTDQGSWMVVGCDETPPKKVRAAYLTISADGTYTFNITSGDGGATGDPGTLAARVRVEGAPVTGEVLVVEKPSSGQWRIAGYGEALGGDGVIAVRVTDGDCYAVGLDAWGLAFAPNLPVTIGQVIRPTLFVGWVYHITEAGVLPASEPVWWDESVEGPQQLGTARAVVARYHQPMAHGPLHIEGI